MDLPVRFIFETFDEAMDVHKELFIKLRDQGVITYADLYSLIYTGEKCKKAYFKYGWTNLWGTKVEPAVGYINGKWILAMPKIKLLKEKENEQNEN